MKFLFDPNKSEANKLKHGIDFFEAQRLFADVDLVVLKARDEGEARQLAVGMIDELHWSAIHTVRSDSVRIISVRRSSREERAAMKEDDLETRFDNGEDVSADFDWESASRPNLAAKHVDIDLPAWIVNRLDREAERLGITRDVLIKVWIAERLG